MERQQKNQHKVINVFNVRKNPEPETTPECKRLLRIIEKTVREARTNPTKQSEAEFRPFFEMLYKNRCKQSLSWFIEEHMKSINIFERKLVKMATYYRQRL